MTTSSNSEERSIDELIDLPYSEMTDDEIERIVQYKADIRTRDALHDERMMEIHNTLQAAALANMEVANKAQARLEELTAHAIQRFEDAS